MRRYLAFCTKLSKLIHICGIGLFLFLPGCGKPAVGLAETEVTLSNTNLQTSGDVVELGSRISTGMEASPLDSKTVARAFTARGIIREVRPDGTSLLIRHEEIPGYMPQMTMPFEVRNTNEAQGLKVGDLVTFQVRATDEDSWIEGIKLGDTNEVVIAALADPPSSALLNAAKLKPGDLFPDAELISETGERIRLSKFSGQAVAFTFIFTRCPLPDFCPRMNQGFSQARQILSQNSANPTNWQFISISFDPEFDKPGVLNRYAFSYRGKNTDGWLFAAAPATVLAGLASELDFRFTDEKGSFLHNLRTVVLDPERRVHAQFNGNKWKAQELADSLVEAAAKREPRVQDTDGAGAASGSR